MAECCRHSAVQKAMVDTKSALSRLMTMVQAEEPDRAEQGLAILLACALGRMCAAAVTMDVMHGKTSQSLQH